MIMNWGEVTQKNYRTLNENGHSHLLQQMIDKYGVGGTPGEMFSTVCYWLAGMRNAKNPAFDLVKEDAELLFQRGYQINYFTKDSLSRV